MSIIYVAHGLTSSGKTEVANYLETKDIFHYHPIRYIKGHYEYLIQKPIFFLDSTEGKSFPIPGNESKTMQEFLVASYHFYKEWMPLRTAMIMASQLPQMCKISDICVVSLRLPKEAETLIKIARDGWHKLILIDLHRNEAIKESSDEYYEEIREMLLCAADAIFPIDNNLSIEYLQGILDDIVRYYR